MEYLESHPMLIASGINNDLDHTMAMTIASNGSQELFRKYADKYNVKMAKKSITGETVFDIIKKRTQEDQGWL